MAQVREGAGLRAELRASRRVAGVLRAKAFADEGRVQSVMPDREHVRVHPARDAIGDTEVIYDRARRGLDDRCVRLFASRGCSCRAVISD